MKGHWMKETFLKVLQRAFEADPSAMHCLAFNRVPCNAALADDPTVVVESDRVLPDLHPQVGLMGILNGILDEAGSDQFLEAKFDKAASPIRLLGFELRNKEDFQ